MQTADLTPETVQTPTQRLGDFRMNRSQEDCDWIKRVILRVYINGATIWVYCILPLLSSPFLSHRRVHCSRIKVDRRARQVTAPETQKDNMRFRKADAGQSGRSTTFSPAVPSPLSSFGWHRSSSLTLVFSSTRLSL